MTTTKMPAGKYYIGDPSYAFDKLWSEVLTEAGYFYDNNSTIKGKPVVGGGTAYGDGEYEDGDGTRYPVDAGIIAAIPVSLLKKENVLTPAIIKEKNYGRVVEFKEEWVAEVDGGIFKFGDIEINTKDDPKEDEDRCSCCGHLL